MSAVLGFACSVALSTALSAINQHQILPKDLPIINALFCIEAALIYFLYMLVSSVLALALSCIEQRPQAAAYDPVPRGFHRDALISSMYLGGSGCFLALPALGFWDISITVAFLLSFTLLALLTEHTKHPDFTPNQDKAAVLAHLRGFRWALYTLLLLLQLGLLAKAGPSSFLLLLLAFVSPLLLRMALTNNHGAVPPSQVLEAALPVSCLHAVLVIGWYNSMADFTTSDKDLATFVPMLVICPFCQAASLAFILRAFSQKQSLPLAVVLTLTAFVVQQATAHRLAARSDWALLALALALLLACAALAFYRARAFMPPDEEPPIVEPLEDEEEP